MIFGDECLFRGNVTDQDKFKFFVTEGNIEITEKYKEKKSLPSYHNVVLATNRDNAIKLESKDERRVFYVTCGPAPKNLDILHKLATDNEVADIYYSYLCDEDRIDVSSFRFGQAKNTYAKNQATADQRPPAAAFLQKLVEEPDYLYREEMRQYNAAEHTAALQLKLKFRPAGMLQHIDPDIALEREINVDARETNALRIYTDIKKAHLSERCAWYFKGQQLPGEQKNAKNFEKVFDNLLGKSKTRMWCLAPTDEPVRTARCYRLPSVEGLKYLLQRESYWVDED